jgi:uncharacterized protein YbcI
MIICLLEDTMTKVEQNLKGIAGEHAVREIRHLFQGASRDQAIAAVERITGERVLSFMTDHDIAADISAQIFILERGEDHDARGAVGGSLDRAAESNEK